MLDTYGWPADSFIIMTDSQSSYNIPTLANIVRSSILTYPMKIEGADCDMIYQRRAINDLVHDARPGDHLFFYCKSDDTKHGHLYF